MHVAAVHKYLMYCMLPAAWVHGFLLFHFNISAVQTLFFATMLGMMVFLTLFIKFTKSTLILFSMFFISYLASSAVSVMVSSQSVIMEEGVVWNFRFFARSVMIGFLSFSICYYWINESENHEWLGRLSLFVWGFFSLAVVAHYFFGFGGVISNFGNLRSQYGSFFTTGNATVFLYLSSWICSHYLIFVKKPLYFQLSMSIATLLVLVAVDSKSALILFILIFGFSYSRPISRKSSVIALLSIYFMLGAGLWIAFNASSVISFLVEIYVNYISNRDIGELEWRLREWDALSILMSTRDQKITIILQEIASSHILQMIFGSTFAAPVSNIFAENDYLDIFYALGLLGGALYIGFGLYLFAWAYQKKEYLSNEILLVRSLFFYVLAQAGASGHVFTEPSTMAFIGIYIAYAMHVVAEGKEVHSNSSKGLVAVSSRQVTMS